MQTATHGFHVEYGDFSAVDDRATQEQELVDAAWDALLAALGLTDTRRLELRSVEAEPEWRALVEGREDRVSTAPHDGALLLPGSFNPLHDGHRRHDGYCRAENGPARGL